MRGLGLNACLLALNDDRKLDPPSAGPSFDCLFALNDDWKLDLQGAGSSFESLVRVARRPETRSLRRGTEFLLLVSDEIAMLHAVLEKRQRV